MPRLTAEQYDERPTGLGATDIAASAGLDPYWSPLEVYLTKIGELDPDARLDDAARGRMERGHRLEDVALEWDRDVTGDAFERVNRTIWHPRIPFIYCHPDARRKPWTKTRRLIEVKTSTRAWKEVPRKTEAQVQIQMACTGATSVDVLVQTFDGPPKRWLVERDDEIIAALERVAAHMWRRIELREPPPMDGSNGAGRWLDSTRWRDEPDLLADPQQRELVAQLLANRQRIVELNGEDERLVNLIKFTMAGSGRLTALGLARVVWTAPYKTSRKSWKEIAAVYRSVIERLRGDIDIVSERVDDLLSTEAGTTSLDDIVSLYTTESEQRSFTVTTLDQRENLT